MYCMLQVADELVREMAETERASLSGAESVSELFLQLRTAHTHVCPSLYSSMIINSHLEPKPSLYI